jgi:signal transduction histidine kinase
VPDFSRFLVEAMMRRPRGRSITARLFLAVGLPASILVILLVVLTWFGARGAVLESLERELKATVAMGASRINPVSARFLLPGDGETRTYKNLVRRLKMIQNVTGSVRVMLIGKDELVRSDGDGALPLYAPAPRVALDRTEFQQALKGVPSVSVPFKSKDGRRFLAAYAKVPERDPAGGTEESEVQPAMVLALEAPADALEATDRLATYLAGLCILFIGLVFGLAFIVARTITFPLLDLAKGAEKLARGELKEELSTPKGRDEVAFLGETLESMRRALSERDTERQMMLAGIAHEVRNPLGGMELFSGLLEESILELPVVADGEEQDQPVPGILKSSRTELGSHAKRVRKELSYLTGVVNDFLNYARETHIQRAPVHIPSLLEDVKSLSVAPEKVPIEIQCDSAADVFPMDEGRIKEALLNLVANAMQATPQDGVVTMRARLDDANLCLEVEDNGSGIDEETLKRVFTPFYTTREKGSGLGLPLAQKFARDHGGQAEIHSTPGQGTRIILVLAPPSSIFSPFESKPEPLDETEQIQDDAADEGLIGDG